MTARSARRFAAPPARRSAPGVRTDARQCRASRPCTHVRLAFAHIHVRFHSEHRIGPRFATWKPFASAWALVARVSAAHPGPFAKIPGCAALIRATTALFLRLGASRSRLIRAAMPAVGRGRAGRDPLRHGWRGGAPRTDSCMWPCAERWSAVPKLAPAEARALRPSDTPPPATRTTPHTARAATSAPRACPSPPAGPRPARGSGRPCARWRSGARSALRSCLRTVP